MPNETMHKHVNKLVNEKSPYLLQHAYNPVDWYPWSEEAFSKAKAEDKPIFLSIGYSTCHWCHVMERESFEDEEVAKILNEKFISIKVDREERPDVDSVYMNVCQAITGSGGWPLTIIMTPDRKPFFAATYIPKESKYGMAGIKAILNNISKAWSEKRDKIIDNSNEIVGEIKQAYQGKRGEEEIGIESVHKAFSDFSYFFQERYGGFNNAPKFPTPQNLFFLLRYWKYSNSKKALDMVTKTLDSMYKGGIFDHVGFGFSRYSTDEKWLVPHFEKMLYDNALLTLAYTEAYTATGKSLYKEIAEKTISYILRDMKHENGGFFSAEDADSEGVEGKFYVWDYKEIIKELGKEDGELYCKYYGITENGNFEGKNIPNLLNTKIEEIENNKDLKDSLEDLNKRLYIKREKRIHPYKDDKILTSWNGLMIAALAYAGRIFDDSMYIQEAKEAVDFIYENLFREDGRLLARFREGDSAYLAYSEDYAFLIKGLIELYQATFEADYLKKAIDLNNDMFKYFWDKDEGGFFLYGEDSEELIWRPKEVYDGAIPSSNSVAALNMLRLGSLTGNLDLIDECRKIFRTFAGKVKDVPIGHAYFMMAVLFDNIPTKEIVIAGDKKSDEVIKFLKEINKTFSPFTAIVLNDNSTILKEVNPSIIDKALVNGKPAVYICENFSCQKPITNFSEAVIKV
ncbi:glycosyl hydrolase family 76 [Clostridium homopropionicum DSM 5847]|uniref:Glycosyl hydrolase family 76 n=1 Tax=Clostridium homopropionicum DSM 5847 TaxID=1121318 RepID=A0A0L6ZF69_9CLOT|nr:thioredoxin domain-containing protein [Clostridium homopropionicum]KOA21428.1 glycosyl hydrolase family 76 [Clostridium homopropionicum DSM 5847]SFG10192.1 hypothetical protein SAMN04488501_105126 [Clostridium homopropionicum]